MSFELLPTLTPWVVGYLVLAVLGALLAVTALGSALAANRPVRIAQRQSIPTYYGRLAFGH